MPAPAPDERHREIMATVWSYGIGVKPQTPLKRSRRSRLRYRWTMATERFRRSLARRIYDFGDDGYDH